MDAYFTRQPVFRKEGKVYGYYLISDSETTNNAIIAITKDIGFDTKNNDSIDNYNELLDQMTLFFDYADNLFDNDMDMLGNRKASLVAVFGKNSTVAVENIKKTKTNGCIVALHSRHIIKNPSLINYADIIQIDYIATSLTAQYAMIKQLKNQVTLLASQIESWDDYSKAADMGYELLQGRFFLSSAKKLYRKEIKPLNTCLVSTLNELNSPEPDFVRISTFIERDLDLTYRLLKLVNSAYIAPKYKISTISQALVFLGTRELHGWVSVMMLNKLKCEENSELIKMSLIRGKLMALVSKQLGFAYSGSEAFFTGLFSMIDVIMNTDMKKLLTELPLSDTVKDALSGKNNALKILLSFVIDYEQARWKKIDGVYPLNLIKPKNMVSLYLEALKWSMEIE